MQLSRANTCLAADACGLKLGCTGAQHARKPFNRVSVPRGRSVVAYKCEGGGAVQSQSGLNSLTGPGARQMPSDCAFTTSLVSVPSSPPATVPASSLPTAVSTSSLTASVSTASSASPFKRPASPAPKPASKRSRSSSSPWHTASALLFKRLTSLTRKRQATLPGTDFAVPEPESKCSDLYLLCFCLCTYCLI